MAGSDQARGFAHVVADEAALRAILGAANPETATKIIDRLDVHCRAFIERSPFVVVATTDADGRCDASPRGGPPGFVEVLDDRRLLLADARGNRIADTLRNVLATGRIGLLFMIPGLSETLRVNGRACVTSDPALLANHEVQAGRPPVLALGVEVEEAFLHCAKAYIRSGLWKPEAWPSTDGLARPARIWLDHATISSTEAEFEEMLVEEYTDHLY